MPTLCPRSWLEAVLCHGGRQMLLRKPALGFCHGTWPTFLPCSSLLPPKKGLLTIPQGMGTIQQQLRKHPVSFPALILPVPLRSRGLAAVWSCSVLQDAACSLALLPGLWARSQPSVSQWCFSQCFHGARLQRWLDPALPTADQPLVLMLSPRAGRELQVAPRCAVWLR